MRAVLLSIQPKYCELIASGKKTIEVRKTKPKIDMPFKCYIYCTIGNGVKSDYLVPSGIQCGKVIGEFVCDDIDTVKVFNDILYCVKNSQANKLGQMCLTVEEVKTYLGENNGYTWHITNLKIYGKPKDLSEFKHWVNDKDYDGWNDQRTKIVKGFVLRPLTRPPQSWCYVEELGE
jgi:predicted transcriptional regulator